MSPELKPSIDKVELINQTTSIIGKHGNLTPIAEELAQRVNKEAIGTVVEFDVLPIGCTQKNAREEDIKRATPMGPAVFNGISRLQTGEWEGQFVLTPENVPFPVNIDQIITHEPSK